MADEPDPTADDPMEGDERTRWLAEVRDALERASAIVGDARAVGRDTTEAEERIALALALIAEFEAGRARDPDVGGER